jgi:hypothetical protein
MITDAPFQEKVLDDKGLLGRAWIPWLQKVGKEASIEVGTANPTSGLYVGRVFYRSDLNKPVWCSSAAGVWRDAAANIIA